MAATPLIPLPAVTAGDAFGWAVQFTDSTQNFQPLTATSQIQLSTPPFTNPAFIFTPAITFPLAGPNYTSAVVTLTMTGSQTAALPLGTYVGDIVLSMAGYGPYTAVSFIFSIIPGVTE